MIRYALVCVEGHAFESWFSDSAGFDRLAEAGALACAVCGSPKVQKAPMAPALGRGTAPAPVRSAPEPQAPATPPPVPPDLAALRRRIEASSEDVGRAFAAEARAIHRGEAPERAIRGEASLAEAKSLVEEDIPVLPLPWWRRRDD